MEMIEAHKNAKNVEETSKGLLDLGEAGVGNLKAARDEIGNSERLAGEIARDPRGSYPITMRPSLREWRRGRTRSGRRLRGSRTR
jgi:hypothetical protein